MSSRIRLLTTATLLMVLAFASTSVALEKRVSLLDDSERDEWSRGTTPCRVIYYNTCQGWIWVWGSWNPGDQFGTHFTSCCPGGYGFHQLLATTFLVGTQSPSGYGFTGSIDVWAADGQGCPTGPALRSTPYLPISGFQTIDWSSSPIDVSGGDFVVTYTIANATLPDQVTFATDHPAVGPTGVAACGNCFPNTRVTRSFYYGTTSAPYCPGSSLFDGVCNAEFMIDVDLACATPVTQTSWGQIKGLYR
ncbi:MAG: hypothetical protein ACT4PE_11760 [Candidatus Eiseniibacteriota bacterium]